MGMFTPVFRNNVHDIEFVFARLHVPNKDYAKAVGKTVMESAKRDNFVDVEFTGEVVDIDELSHDTENLRIVAPFNTDTGEKDYIIILTPAGEVPPDFLDPQE